MGKFNSSKLAIFYRWIIKREEARRNKEAGEPKPWTDDPVIQAYRFCNVRRMDDKVSAWLMDRWYPAHATQAQFAVAATLARMINWPDTLSFITDGCKFKLFENARSFRAIRQSLRAWKLAGNKVFTGVYIINGRKGQDKINTIVDVAESVYALCERGKGALICRNSMRLTHANFMRVKCIGSFIAGQIVADLRFTNAMIRPPSDCMEWAPIGPGSRRGMRRLLGLPAIGPMTQTQFEPLLRELCELVWKHKDIWHMFCNRGLEAMDIQNCLCEFDKYSRVLNKEGRPRNGYDGAGQSQQGDLQFFKQDGPSLL